MDLIPRRTPFGRLRTSAAAGAAGGRRSSGPVGMRKGHLACLQAGGSSRRPTYFLCWCKESRQRKHLESMRRTISSVDVDRCAPAGGVRALAKHRSTAVPGQHGVMRPLSRPGGIEAAARFSWHREAGENAKGEVVAIRIPGRGKAGYARTSPGTPVERGFARAGRPPVGAQRSGATPEMVCVFQGAFFAYFLCTSKESRSAAGTTSRPAGTPTNPCACGQDRRPPIAPAAANVRNGPKGVVRRPSPHRASRAAQSAVEPLTCR
jgi:hypothetical protein